MSPNHQFALRSRNLASPPTTTTHPATNHFRIQKRDIYHQGRASFFLNRIYGRWASCHSFVAETIVPKLLFRNYCSKTIVPMLTGHQQAAGSLSTASLLRRAEPADGVTGGNIDACANVSQVVEKNKSVSPKNSRFRPNVCRIL